MIWNEIRRRRRAAGLKFAWIDRVPVPEIPDEAPISPPPAPSPASTAPTPAVWLPAPTPKRIAERATAWQAQRISWAMFRENSTSDFLTFLEELPLRKPNL